MISNQATTTAATSSSSKTSSISASPSTRAARKPATDSVEEVEFVGIRSDYDDEGQRPRTRAELQRRQAREKTKRKVKIELPRQLKGETLCPIPECRKMIYVRGGCRTITCYNKSSHPDKSWVYFCAYCKNTTNDGILRGCLSTCPENFNPLDRLEYCQVIHPVDEDDGDASAMESDSTQRHFSSESVSTASDDGINAEPDVEEDDAADGGNPACRDRRNTALITFENDVSVKREPDAVVSSAYDEDTVNDDETVYPEEVKSAITNVPTASDRKTSKSRSALDTASTTNVAVSVGTEDYSRYSLKKRKPQTSNDEREKKKTKKRKKKKTASGRKKCSADGCTNGAVNGGVCIKHGAKVKVKKCSTDGCKNRIRTGGVCTRHGAKREECRVDGCTNNAKNGGVCFRHGAAKKECSAEGCTNGAVNGGVCIKHGAKVKAKKRYKYTCSVVECKNKALKGGVCRKHGAKAKECSADGCTNNALKGGVCFRHGAAVNKPKQCSTKGCTNQAQKGGVCIRHGAQVKVKLCSTEGCTNRAVKEGVCIKHGANKKRKRCSSEGCTNIVIKRGLCIRHGAHSKTP